MSHNLKTTITWCLLDRYLRMLAMIRIPQVLSLRTLRISERLSVQHDSTLTVLRLLTGSP